MIQLNQSLITGLLIGLVVGFIGHSLISKSIRIAITMIAILIVVWLFYSNSLKI